MKEIGVFVSILCSSCVALAQIVASHGSGFYNEPFTLELTSDFPDHQIRYSINGDIPSFNSPVFPDKLILDERALHRSRFSMIPTTPIPNRAGPNANYYTWSEPDTVLQAVILRVAQFKNEARVSEVQAFTYFIGEEFQDLKFPVFSLVTDSNSLFHSDSGIYIPGNSLDTSNMLWTGNYQLGGSGSERQVHIQFFKNTELLVDQLAGLRIHGMLVAAAPQKSLRLYARNEYGNRFFSHSFFAQDSIDRYRRIILRSPYSCDDAFFTDAFIHDVARTIGQDVMASMPALVFINGEFWGIHNIRERMDKWYIGSHYPKLNPREVNILNHRKNPDEGNDEEYTTFIEFVEHNSMLESRNYEVMDSLLDIDNFIDYMILETYFDNRDWGGNNVKFWKPQGSGKWRLLLIDCDKVMVDPKVDDIDRVSKEVVDISTLTHALMAVPDFRKKYFARYAVLLKTVLSTSFLNSKLDSFITLYRPEMTRHGQRWRYPRSSTAFTREMSDYRRFFAERKRYYLHSFRAAYDPGYDNREEAPITVSEQVLEEEKLTNNWWLILISVLVVVGGIWIAINKNRS